MSEDRDALVDAQEAEPALGAEYIVRDGIGCERRVKVVTSPHRGRVGVRNVNTGRLSYLRASRFGTASLRLAALPKKRAAPPDARAAQMDVLREVRHCVVCHCRPCDAAFVLERIDAKIAALRAAGEGAQ